MSYHEDIYGDPERRPATVPAPAGLMALYVDRDPDVEEVNVTPVLAVTVDTEGSYVPKYHLAGADEPAVWYGVVPFYGRPTITQVCEVWEVGCRTWRGHYLDELRDHGVEYRDGGWLIPSPKVAEETDRLRAEFERLLDVETPLVSAALAEMLRGDGDREAGAPERFEVSRVS